MSECRDCIHWKPRDRKKPLAWGDCNYYVVNPRARPVWDNAKRPIVGYVSPTQKGCGVFDDGVIIPD